MKKYLLAVCDLLGLEDTREEIGAGIIGGEAERILKCLNTTNRELAADYLPLVISERTVSSGLVPYSALSRSAYRVRRVVLSGKNVPYRLTADGIRTPEGEVEIEYSYLPADLTPDDEWHYEGRVSQSVLVFGAAAEYCLACGRFEDAGMWFAKFQNALPDTSSRGRTLPARRWLV